MILRYTESTELVMGVILIVVVLFIPSGFMGLFNLFRLKLKARFFDKTKVEKAS